MTDFNPHMIDLDTADPTAIVCYLELGQNEYNGKLGSRIAALFVILFVSSAATFFPVLAAKNPWFKINIYVYLFARYFGAGVIVTTAFVHLLDPAYGEIGPNTCVGMTGHWADYSWCPVIVLLSVLVIFFMDFLAEQYVERKYGFAHGPSIEDVITDKPGTESQGGHGNTHHTTLTHSQMHSGDQDPKLFDKITAAQGHLDRSPASNSITNEKDAGADIENASITSEMNIERSFRQQICAFLILEFGVIFHSIIIGLNLGTAGEEFATLFPVLVFHQSFEGLGIGARLSAIPFPKRLSWLPWALCTGYGLTTPIAIAIGLGLRTTYNSGSFTANVISGVLDAISAGILLYTGLVELLARDFLFNPDLTRQKNKLAFMLICVLLGCFAMALLGKWA